MMFIMEVKPKRTWRGLRMARAGRLAATVTTRHSATSHWFTQGTAESILRELRSIRQAGLEVTVDGDHRRVTECACRAESLRGKRRGPAA